MVDRTRVLIRVLDATNDGRRRRRDRLAVRARSHAWRRAWGHRHAHQAAIATFLAWGRPPAVVHGALADRLTWPLVANASPPSPVRVMASERADLAAGPIGDRPRAALNADPDSLLQALVVDHLPAMYRVAKVIVRDDALAEDVVQESLLKAWQAAASYRGEASLRSWATRITHNTAVSVLRRRREELRDPHLLPDTAPSAGADRIAQDRLMVQQLWQALDRLDPITKAIVVLREVDGLSYEDICDALHLALPTVKTRLFRARKLLAADLEGSTP